MDRKIANMLTEIGINLGEEDYNGNHKGRRVRFVPKTGMMQVSDNNFDRWANSVELTFDVQQPKGRRQFARWANS